MLAMGSPEEGSARPVETASRRGPNHAQSHCGQQKTGEDANSMAGLHPSASGRRSRPFRHYLREQTGILAWARFQCIDRRRPSSPGPCAVARCSAPARFFHRRIRQTSRISSALFHHRSGRSSSTRRVSSTLGASGTVSLHERGALPGVVAKRAETIDRLGTLIHAFEVVWLQYPTSPSGPLPLLFRGHRGRVSPASRNRMMGITSRLPSGPSAPPLQKYAGRCVLVWLKSDRGHQPAVGGAVKIGLRPVPGGMAANRPPGRAGHPHADAKTQATNAAQRCRSSSRRYAGVDEPKRVDVTQAPARSRSLRPFSDAAAGRVSSQEAYIDAPDAVAFGFNSNSGRRR